MNRIEIKLWTAIGLLGKALVPSQNDTEYPSNSMPLPPRWIGSPRQGLTGKAAYCLLSVRSTVWYRWLV